MIDPRLSGAGLRLGAGEASFFVGRLMKLGTLEGLPISKIFAIVTSFARS